MTAHTARQAVVHQYMYVRVDRTGTIAHSLACSRAVTCRFTKATRPCVYAHLLPLIIEPFFNRFLTVLLPYFDRSFTVFLVSGNRRTHRRTETVRSVL